MIPSMNGTSGTQQQDATSGATKTPAIDQMASEQTFLKLFVAQLQNQDPMQPQDPQAFVAQLAQFSSLEQQLQIRTDLDSINKILGAQFPVTTDAGQKS